MTTKQSLITPEQAADHLSVSVRTLAKWRSVGFPNIPYVKVSRCVRYRISDLDVYITKHSHNMGEA